MAAGGEVGVAAYEVQRADADISGAQRIRRAPGLGEAAQEDRESPDEQRERPRARFDPWRRREVLEVLRHGVGDRALDRRRLEDYVGVGEE